MAGTVYLVGAGPGDAGLVTVRGLELVRRADCILYDRLAAPELLWEAKEGCECIYVGKADGRHSLPQEKIHELLLEKAEQYDCVVRLKGGDPYVFGRGGEEGCFLQKHGMDFVVVPGVSSAIAGPACAGIPVTHRGLAGSFRVITAHRRGESDTPVDFSSMLDASETLVFLMGLGRVGEIAEGLMRAGRAAATPAAVIAHAATWEQQVCAGVLEDIAARVAEAGLTSPAVIVVGAVASLRESLQDHRELPFRHRRFLLPKIGDAPSRLGLMLRRQGAEVDELSVGRIVRIPAVYAPERFDGVDWLVFTSKNGVNGFFENLFASGLDVRAVAHMQIATVGRATAEVLRGYGLQADFICDTQTGEALGRELAARLAGESRVLYPCAGENAGELARILEAHCRLEKSCVYRNEKYNEELTKEIVLENYDAILFTCASNARRLLQGQPVAVRKRLSAKGSVYSIGRTTSAALAELGVEEILEAERPDYGELVRLLMGTLGGE
ncbi:MAG: uroporphyrinogen-III C-methyltransferase [Muribaculaceae bacterium]|nr:uroporphyrinogen-III C-methyltransferase [Roseburia sp.]MCM1430056.1 uroporphyrinogen-III C-methyltransferase [Muribaculaceae bacterium]MCM1493871.1 uroporphyrinogen-III C-methyltransferase [Muribaculaceae bacterium]